MNKIFRNITDFIENRIGVDNAILFFCLLILAVHYYSMIGSFTEVDEEYYFYVSSAISRGMGLYSDLHCFYPPVSLYLCSIFFMIFSNLYHAMLSARIFIMVLSLCGFCLIFDIFKKMKLSWFMIPATLFILYSMEFNLLAIRFRPDHVLCFVLILQCYLIFLLPSKEKLSDLIVSLILFLGFLSFHVSQKALHIEPFLMLALLLTYFDIIKRFIMKYRTSIFSIAFLTALYVIFSESYHRFLNECYILLPAYFKGMQRWHHYNIKNNLDFLLMHNVNHNIAFWLTGLASFLTFLFFIKRDKRYLVPLMFLFGTSLVILNGITMMGAYRQYQLYCVWAILFALPYFIGICYEIFPKRKLFIFSLITLLALSGFFTYGRYTWPSKPLKTYAAEIDRVRQAIGQDSLASLCGASINIPTILPYLDSLPVFHADYDNVRSVLIKKSVKFVFIDQRGEIKQNLFGDDGHFIAANYQMCHDLPLMIASKWVYADTGEQDVPVEISGNYKVLMLAKPNTKVKIDDHTLKNTYVLYLKRGKHIVQADGPAALLIEYNSHKTSSESLYNLNLSKYEFIPLNILFSGKFELLGMLKYEKSNKLFYHVFWKVLSDLSDIDNELMTFHHCCDVRGNIIAGVNIDPADGWYDIRNLKKNEVISYDFSFDKNERIKSVHIGWYFKRDWNMRLRYDDSTFFTLQI